MTATPSARMPTPKRLSPRQAGASGHDARRRALYSRLNDVAGVYVAASAVLTAVPVGLNRPTLWLSWVALTALFVAGYLLLGRYLDRSRGLLSSRHPVLFGLALLVPAYALVQSFPGLGDYATWPPAPNSFGADTISLLPDASRIAALRFTGYILFGLLAIEVASRSDRAHRIAWIIFWGIVAHGAFGLTALNSLGDVTVWGAPKEVGQGAATGTFIGRNNFATFLGVGMVLGLSLLYERVDKPASRRARSASFFTSEVLDRSLTILGLLIIAATLLSTQSRGGVLASALGVAACFLTMRAKAGVPVWRSLMWLLVLGLGGVVAAIPVYGQDLVTRFLFLGFDADFRLPGYERILELIAQRPWAGYGLDAFRPAFEMVHTAPFMLDRVWDRAHSTILSNWVELGLIIGSVPILIAVIAAGRLVSVVWRRERDYGLPVAGLSAILLCGAHSLIDFSLEMPAVTILLIAVLGLGLAHRTPAVRRGAEGRKGG